MGFVTKRMVLLAFAALFAWSARADRFALCVGLDEYDETYVPRDSWLCQCAVDVESVRSLLVSCGGWDEPSVTCLVDGQGSREAILAGLRTLADVAEPGDQVLYYHSGHGKSRAGSDVCLCAYDGDFEQDDLAQALADFKVGVKVLVVIDTCYSGGMILLSENDETRPATDSPIAWIASADDAEYAYELTGEDGGVFTRAWTQGIVSGAADSADLLGDGDGQVTAWESALYAAAAICGWSTVQCPEAGRAVAQSFVLAEAMSCELKEAMDPAYDWVTSAVDREDHGGRYFPIGELDGIGWFGEGDESLDGQAARSGAIVDFASVSMGTRVSGAGKVSFRWKVSSERHRDELTFSVDGVTVGRISGTDGGWTNFTCEVVGGGTHDLSWTYAKDAEGSDGEDCGWVDLFVWAEDAPEDVPEEVPPPPPPGGGEEDAPTEPAAGPEDDGKTLADPQLGAADLQPVETPVAALSYTGYVTNGAKIVGLVTVKVTKRGVVTATVRLPKGTKLAKAIYKGRLAEGGEATLSCPKNGGAMSALVCEGIVSGLVVAGGETLGFIARSSAKDVLADLDGFSGKVWTVALKSAPAEDLPAPMNGYSVLSVACGKKGKAKVSGVLADGTKVSLTAQGMAFGDSVVVPVVCRKRTVMFSLKLILKEDGTIEVGNVSAWTSGNGTATWEKALASELEKVAPSVKVSLSLDAKDVIAAFGGEVAASPAAPKLTYKKKTGRFTGSFRFYQTNGTKRRKLKATVNGVVVGGKGYGTATVKKTGSQPLTVDK